MRARYYHSEIRRFLTRDTWKGDDTLSVTLNSWLYAHSNPILYVDPSGHISCFSSTDPKCMAAAENLRYYAVAIKSNVKYGILPPVEGFALLANYAEDLFGHEMRGIMWGMTNVINGFDPNDPSPVWMQAITKRTFGYFIEEDWLPYRNNPDYNDKMWRFDDDNPKNDEWIHSQRGDWRSKYWDKTANQAYHFWFNTAVTFFDGGDAAMASLGNLIHDPFITWEDIDFEHEDMAPPSKGSTHIDYDLGVKGVELGKGILWDYAFTHPDWFCDPDYYVPYPGEKNLAAWIRANLKE